tara:strand:- start:2878 stop:4431 length:1554 start_codon:yes stop_codon:yes gene_type:complete
LSINHHWDYILRFILWALAIYLTFSAAANEKVYCLEQKEVSDGAFGEIECLNPYHHYNSSAVKRFYSYKEAMKTKNIRISTFNVYQAGSTKTEFKDYEIVAKIINNWDVIGAVELVSNTGENRRHNESIYEEIELLKENPRLSTSERNKKIKFLKKQYTQPGYLKILEELMKLDPSWSLVLTPRDDGSRNATVKELAGYFYRARIVKPVDNEYCENFVSNKNSIACYVNFDKNFYGRNVSSLISRLPFIGSFRSGRFDFSLLLTHTVFTPTSDPVYKKKILNEAFNVDDHTDLGFGVTAQTYQRFAEIKHLLNFVQLYKNSFKENDLILLGDMNLNGDEEFWAEMLRDFGNTSVKVKEKTTIARSFERGGEPTKGLANNYDHFIFDDKTTAQCAGRDNFKAYNFMENQISHLINRKYFVRGRRINNHDVYDFKLSKDGEEKVKYLRNSYSRYVGSLYTVSRGEIVKRFTELDEKIEDIDRKLFLPQLRERSYYRYFQEVVSDHLPIYMTCRNTYDED